MSSEKNIKSFFSDWYCNLLHYLFVDLVVDMHNKDYKIFKTMMLLVVFVFVSVLYAKSHDYMIFVYLFLFFFGWYVYAKTFECILKKELALNWTKVYTSYLKDDFGAIGKATKKIKKIEYDPLLKLLDVEKYLYGKTVYQDKKTAVDLLLEIDKEIKLPEKTNYEKHRFTKKQAEKRKKTQIKIKKEKYLKSIKAKAREIWNNNGFWSIKHDYYSELHTHKDEPIGIIRED